MTHPLDLAIVNLHMAIKQTCGTRGYVSLEECVALGVQWGLRDKEVKGYLQRLFEEGRVEIRNGKVYWVE